ncbi:MAG: ASCH domain-containing protein [Marinospirillum sp.]|uniref:ASCH domain-containing protein n=1 Tax=Marinospirillum sp. TaxID=2183934 RepID=UPI001A09059E|nr:ASCH domain-containing protein [Marinospirillum sp.]MBE0506764.1 ASCH domain-containing protein [Marinospirillum sp.]
MIDRALIVRQPWIDLILSGEKTWEMRSRSTRVRGRIGLIEQGTGLIVGEVSLTGVLKNISDQTAFMQQDRHRVQDLNLLEHWNHAWILSGAVRYETPVPYVHPRGAVTWVKLPGSAE